MKERIEQEITCLCIQLEKCNYYEDAKELLNAYIIDLINNYGGVAKLVKRAVFDAIIRKLDEAEIFDKDVLDNCDDEIKREERQFVTFMRQCEKRHHLLRIWMEDWRIEPAPKMETDKKYRLYPKTYAVIDKAIFMFDYLVSTGKLDRDSREMWMYLCGVHTSVEKKKPIRWCGTWGLLSALLETFLCNKKYFEYEEGILKYFICDGMFINTKGTILKEKNLASSKNQANLYGSLDDGKQQFEDVLKQS